jgi:beta-glucosidase
VTSDLSFPNANDFPPGFLFGAATAAYQIEGAVAADGRGQSWWDTFAHTPGRIRDASNGDTACGHYERVEADLDLMRTLGMQAYRFSIAWPRVLPEGRGRVNAEGLDFYERLVDGLLARGIVPYATLYHWDLPQTLADEGGWQVRSTVEAFAEYTDCVVRRLGDRVARWATLNEPRCSAYVGHLEGRHAPGLQDLRATLQAAHHLLFAHGKSVAAARAAHADVSIGIVLDVKPYYAHSDSPEDATAAHRGDGIFNRWFLDALFRGQYPNDIVDDYAAYLPEIRASDMATISVPIDHLGINYCTRSVVRHAAARPYPHLEDVRVPGAHYSTMEWEDYPDGLHTMLTRLARDYAPRAIYVAENGAAELDVVDSDGRVRDDARTRYLAGHLRACAHAIANGVPLDAYLVWSLMDNFEWGRGYTQRFGLVYIDYDTLARIPKDSAIAYRDFVVARKAVKSRP